MTVSRSVARFTAALTTPGRPWTVFSTRAEQAAQLIPVTGKVAVTAGTSYPAERTVSTSDATDTLCGSKVTWAFSVAKLTAACSTPGTWPRAFSTRSAQAAQLILLIGIWTVSVTGLPSRAQG